MQDPLGTLTKKELSSLHSLSKSLTQKLRAETERLSHLNSSLHLAKQQIIFFTQETSKALEGIKDTNWQFTKEACSSFLKLKMAPPALTDLIAKFMLVLEQHDRSFKNFLAITKNYIPLKNLMSSVQPVALCESQMSELLPLWKHCRTIHSAVDKHGKGAQILTDWLAYLVEYKLKYETLVASKRKLPHIEKNLKQQHAKIAELHAEILGTEERIAECQYALQNPHDTDTSLPSLTASFTLPGTLNRTVCCAPLQRGTASGGILKAQTSAEAPDEFPNFDHKELYGEVPRGTVRPAGQDSIEIQCEGANEVAGCCRTRFFCF